MQAKEHECTVACKCWDRFLNIAAQHTRMGCPKPLDTIGQPGHTMCWRRVG